MFPCVSLFNSYTTTESVCDAKPCSPEQEMKAPGSYVTRCHTAAKRYSQASRVSVPKPEVSVRLQGLPADRVGAPCVPGVPALGVGADEDVNETPRQRQDTADEGRQDETESHWERGWGAHLSWGSQGGPL